MKLKALFLIILCFIPFVAADEGEDYSDVSSYEALNSFTDSSGSDIDTVDGCDIVSFKYNKTTKELTFEIYNSNTHSVTMTAYDIYSKRNTEITLEPGRNYKEFNSVQLKSGRFCFVFWKQGGNMAIVKEFAIPLTLQQKFYVASSNALGFLSLQSGCIFAFLVISGQLLVKELLYKKMLIDYWKQGFAVIAASFVGLIFAMLSLKYGLPIGWYEVLTIGKWDFVLKLPFLYFKNWNMFYLISYFNWIYPVALLIGIALGFHLSKPEYINFWYMDFKNNMRDIKILPVSWERDIARVRWDDGKIRVLKMPSVNATKYVNPMTGHLEDLYEITSFEVETQDKVYDYTSTSSLTMILIKIESFIESIKNYFGRVHGTVKIAFSKIMSKTVAESIFLHDSLETIAEDTNLWVEKYYDEKYLKSVKARRIAASGVEKIARDLNPLAMEKAEDLLGGIDDIFEMGIPVYKKPDEEKDNDSGDSENVA
ncbi:hypothetical protein HNP86_001081 [Methanococcus maripaludis]|uniref:Uncharacterized protein n=1 Tax=Methanococcus maripaludis TaxID=39152 RepID=A0A7J9NTF3_METMI|nr:hypothetical protein [Methanococcus maripaludis]MBA2846490.1 hypothetical protein [Methanococcus maripaludis]MBA2850950.1 hypothetical protein [Methanococcus maripaludis]